MESLRQELMLKDKIENNIFISEAEKKQEKLLRSWIENYLIDCVHDEIIEHRADLLALRDDDVEPDDLT